ncbi:M56 family metallopeptidase [Flavobacterium sp.]|uniref:M56 family metallopeptidase n=1 Tax=Flavobacterium sp. TaxID=239 RepID=UPI00261422B5|nr:M56 family metallopeptidase [Flavobacterium sp.]MDG2432931.1 M56 family metallopeptidase [Flavobacterium sp.]
MELIAIYLLKSCGLLLLFFAAYHFLLRKETFFTANRWFLVAGLITSVILPLVVFTTIVWVEPNPEPFDWSKMPVRAIAEEDTTERYIYFSLALLYTVGVLGLLTKFGFDFYSLRKLFKGQPSTKKANFVLIDSSENRAPFSFFKTIVYNSALYNASELQNILEHEKVHSEQYHSVDVLLSRLFCILFWFNPVVWWYKKAIIQNLEFIADSVALKRITDKKAYQITLLKITTQEQCVALANPFYQSLIKKRIVMLNKNQSHKRNSWKYATVVPALIGFMLLFQVEVVAQEKAPKETNKTTYNTVSSAVEVMPTDSIKKMKTAVTSSETTNTITAETEIYINGKKVSKQELDATDAATIATMNVTKNNGKNTIEIITKDNKNTSSFTFETKTASEELDVEKIDPTNLTGAKGPRGSYTVTSISTSSDKNTLPTNVTYFVNGKKVSPLEAESLSPNDITSVDVDKNTGTNKNAVRIVTKNYVYNKVNVPEPPTPPTPPTFNFKTPKAPNFPKAPLAPKGSPSTGDKKEWADFNKKMEEFEKKMKAIEPEIAAFDKKMAEFDKQMEPFNAKMKVFEKEMEVYEKQMKAYQAKIKANK